MKSYHANSGAGLSGLVIREHDKPKRGRQEVLVRVHANSLNFRELSVLAGNYPLPVKPDVVMCADGAGEIVEVGPGESCEAWRPGGRRDVPSVDRWTLQL
jgi:NADPH:quinone reductase-like Zn-dependent oxidoreductase